MSCHHKAIAAIVSFSTTNHDGSRDSEFAQHVRAGTARILHQNEPQQPEFINRPTVNLADLVTSQEALRHPLRLDRDKLRAISNCGMGT